MSFEYDITLSFAGEDREYVDKVAELLKENEVKVFYDKFEEVDLWGKDLGIHFDTVYRKSARFCIPFISQHYKKKAWTNFELRNVLSRAIMRNEEYILPARFDDTELEGIRPTLGFVDLRKKSPEEFVNMILAKLGSESSIPISEKFQDKIDGVIRIWLLQAFSIGSFGNQPEGPTINVVFTNKLIGEHRYFYEPSFGVTIAKNERESGFYLADIWNPTKFPIKLEYGEVFEKKYVLNESQREVLEEFDEECEFFGICTTTIGEKFESNRIKVQNVLDLFDSM